MLSVEKMRLLEFYNKGIELYKQRNFEGALAEFRQAQTVDPADGPTNLYVSRCEAYIANPPPADWDGVFVMTTK